MAHLHTDTKGAFLNPYPLLSVVSCFLTSFYFIYFLSFVFCFSCFLSFPQLFVSKCFLFLLSYFYVPITLYFSPYFLVTFNFFLITFNFSYSSFSSIHKFSSSYNLSYCLKSCSFSFHIYWKSYLFPTFIKWKEQYLWPYSLIFLFYKGLPHAYSI